ncbi:fumarylacetoacetate hydrolase family protein [Pusillimonas sp.]|uniref:fumarylacetoacetate hydrolase family protein n=1 Tax=Pusillimonas sp. TaxID=3040095 RepID=UPI0029BE0561|nr:fumarylacetoacetate hydrolase family protein [Pusillimonas sp.]MDX3895227.1 fumarylacetoacetate hydrolase family protein [Pusillimonas sp.]
MKYQLFTYRAAEGEARPGIAVEDVLYDLRQASGEVDARWSSVDDLLQDWQQAAGTLRTLAGDIGADAAAYKSSVLTEPQFLAPLTRCGVVYGAGANYRDHVEAMARALNMNLVVDPKSEGIDPWHFIKAGQATLAGHKEEVAMPGHTARLDWEAELAVVIGRRASHVSTAEALDYVAGYSCANDLSARDNLKRDAIDASSPFKFDWIGHKCFKGACPIGPFITPAEFVGSPEVLDIKLWLNDELKQDSNTSNHLYSVAEQISYLSQRLDLLPGDILLTGTPAGVGMETGVFLQRGDVMRVWIDGLGELETRIV